MGTKADRVANELSQVRKEAKETGSTSDDMTLITIGLIEKSLDVITKGESSDIAEVLANALCYLGEALDCMYCEQKGEFCWQVGKGSCSCSSCSRYLHAQRFFEKQTK